MQYVRLTIGAAVLACLVVVVSSPLVLADDPPLRELTATQDMALRDFAASLIVAGPNVEMVADLRPPRTTYQVRFAPAEYENIMNRFDAWGETDGEGEAALGSVEHPFVTSWKAEPGCGTWEVASNVGTWNHPDGEAPAGCPHEQGTSHPGTVTVNGTYGINVFLATNVDTDPLLKGTWSYACTYTGSESGTAKCEETLMDLDGRYGTLETGPQQQPRRTKAIAVVAIVVVGVMVYVFRKQILRGVRPVMMRDPQ